MLVQEKSMRIDIVKAYIKIRRMFDTNYVIPSKTVEQLLNKPSPMVGKYETILPKITQLVSVYANVNGIDGAELKISKAVEGITLGTANSDVIDEYREVFKDGANIDSVLKFAVWCGDITQAESHVQREYMRVTLSRIHEAA